MNKQELLQALKAKLSGLPDQDIKKACEYYSEMIDDKIEDGLSEADAVAALGSVDQIAAQTLSGVSLPKLVKNKANRSLNAREIILLILASPIWIPLLAAAMCLFLSVYLILWTLVISLYAIVISFAAGTIGCIAAGIAFLFNHQITHGILYIGLGIICSGVTILMSLLAGKASKASIKLSKKLLIKIKLCFVKGGK